jgi:hypothetical protein
MSQKTAPSFTVVQKRLEKICMGYFAVCTGTENNGFGIYEADSTAK